MYKGQEGENVKTHYKIGNDLVKMCFEHKTKM
jgi:cyclopropane fatty-acyl-phospholipid synthase-like methyltransferase